jgi:hypothetical protein
MATTAARRRFLIARASIAKRRAANDAVVYAVPPAGRFQIRIAGVAGETTSETLSDGTLAIRNARLLLESGAEIDGATVVVHDDHVDDVRAHLQFSDLDVEGEAVVTDYGYCLVTYHQPELRQAA